MTQILGQTKRKYLFLCQGTLPEKAMRRVAWFLVQTAGMTIARRARVDRYPYRGRGGQGFTLYQPLMESYLMIDVYTDINETEILLSTCKPERVDLSRLLRVLDLLVGSARLMGEM